MVDEENTSGTAPQRKVPPLQPIQTGNLPKVSGGSTSQEERAQAAERIKNQIQQSVDTRKAVAAKKARAAAEKAAAEKAAADRAQAAREAQAHIQAQQHYQAQQAQQTQQTQAHHAQQSQAQAAHGQPASAAAQAMPEPPVQDRAGGAQAAAATPSASFEDSADALASNAPAKRAKNKASVIGDLISKLSDQVRALIIGEINLAKMKTKAMIAKVGAGAAMLAVAAVLALYMLGILLYAAIAGLSTVLPAWASALIVAGALLLLVIIFALIGAILLKRGTEDKPEPQVGMKKNVEAMKKGLNHE